MPAPSVWIALSIYAAGLVAGLRIGPGVFPLLSVVLLVTAGTLLSARRGGRSSLMLFLLLIALNEGAARSPGRYTSGTEGGEVVKEGLRNPGYTPLLRLPSARSHSPAGPAPLPRPYWASRGVWGLVQGVLMNRREEVSSDWSLAFRSVGAAHLLAVSGLHIGILLAMLLGLLRICGLSRPLRGLVGMAGLWVYVMGIGAPPSALRAGAMATVALMLWMSGRRDYGGRIVPAALLATLLCGPGLIGTVGFQLSATAVIGIGLATRGIDAAAMRSRLGRWRTFVRVSLGAQAGALPVQILTFGTITPLAPLLNLIVVPLAGVWLPSVVFALLLDILGVPAPHPVGAFAEVMGRVLVWCVLLVDRVPGALVPVPGWVGWVAAAGFLLWAWDGRGRIAALAVLVVVVWSPVVQPAADRIVFLDVGQGDAIVLEGGAPRRTVVVDAGSAHGEWSAGGSVVAPYLRRRGVRRIDLLIATHADIDHIGGMTALVERFEVGALLRGAWGRKPGGAARRLLRECLARGVPIHSVEAADLIDLGGGFRIEVLAGSDGVVSYGSGSNDRSVVLRVIAAQTRVLLTGDLEFAGERRLAPFRSHLDSEVLKVSHHGSGDATSARLLEVVHPDLAVISVGARNRYGHPSPLLLARLGEAGVELWRTDRRGALVLRPDRRGESRRGRNIR